jgi:predicted Zn-dependent protease
MADSTTPRTRGRGIRHIAVLGRVALAAVALLVLAYLAVGLRNVVLAERGERLAAVENPTAAQVDEAERLLERARLLDPDTRPLLAEAALLTAHGSRREGRALVERAVRREPDNVLAWGVLADLTRESDPARSRAAEVRRRALSPPVPPE